MVRTGAAVIVVIGLAFTMVAAAEAEPLGFAGFDRAMDIGVWIERYPRASREFTPGADTRGDNPGEWSTEFLRARNPGRYALRFPPEEAPDHIHYVQADMRDGTIERLWLLLEKPLIKADPRHPTRSNEARYPACGDVPEAVDRQVRQARGAGAAPGGGAAVVRLCLDQGAGDDEARMRPL